MIRKLLNVLVIAAGVGAFPGMMLEIVAKTRITPATTVMMMPRITKTIEIITFRECAAPKAFRPRMTKMAPTKIKMKPMTPMYGSQPMRVPTRMSRTPVFVRSICRRGRPRPVRPLDLAGTGPSELRPGRRKEEPHPAARRARSGVPHAGGGPPSVRPGGTGPVRGRPDAGGSGCPPPSSDLDGPRGLGRRHPHGRAWREGPAGGREVRSGLPVPRRPDGGAALPSHRPRAPPRRRAPARLQLSLLRRLGLLAARRGRPRVFRDVVVDGAHLLGLFLRLLGLDEFHDSLFSEHPVVDAPLPAVVEGRLFPLRRQDAGVLEHVEGVPVLRFQDVVDDPLGITEEIEDVLGHRPGLFLFHARPVDRVLDRPRQVVHGERAGRTPLGFRLDGHGWSRPRPMGIPGYLRVLRRHFPLILTRRTETREGGFGGRHRKKVNPLRLHICRGNGGRSGRRVGSDLEARTGLEGTGGVRG